MPVELTRKEYSIVGSGPHPDLDDGDARDTSRVIRGVSNEFSAAFVDTQSWTVFDETAGWTEILGLPQTSTPIGPTYTAPF